MTTFGEVRSSGSRLRTLLANYSIALVSLVLSYFLVEFFFFQVIFPAANPSVRPHLHGTPGILAQRTKAGFAPRDYIVILGDSMAEGLGDTFLAAGYNAARTIHAAHVIRELTGRDVVSFGRGGASSAESLVREPTRILAGSRCLFFPTIEEPSQIFAYFYEGNDVQDNLVFAKRVAEKFGGADRQAVDEYLSNDYASFTMWRCHLYLVDIASRIWSLLYRHYYVGINPLPQIPLGSMLLVDGKVIDGPAPLDGPAVEVGDEDIRAGIAIFDRSLSWLRARFPRVPITVVYVPAALSIYHLTGSAYLHAIEPRDEGRSDLASPARIARNSDLICNLVQGASARHGVGFLDTRPALRQAASMRLLHGPLDWIHFNEQGYRALGKVMADRVDLARVDPCN